MFASHYFAPHYYAANYFAEGGSTTGSPLVAPVLLFVYSTSTAIRLSFTDATGGDGAYVYSINRDGVEHATGVTSPYDDSDDVASRALYSYTVTVTDGTTATEDSNIITAGLPFDGAGGGTANQVSLLHGVLEIPQGMDWGDSTVSSIIIEQEDGNWPVLSTYTALSGSNGGVVLTLTIRPNHAQHPDYSTSQASFDFPCTATGASPNQVIIIRPGTSTANLFPDQSDHGISGPAYKAEIWAINTAASNRCLLFAGLCRVPDDITV